MSRAAVEVADILRAQGSRFLSKYQASFGYQKLKAFRAIQNCRTAALGGHLDACSKCGQQAISYNSCRNRHCPKCQAQARQRWLAAREREVLPTHYFHVVFSVPHELNVFALENPRAFYDLLFTASTASALEMAANPERLGAEIGLIAILHTWGQNLTLHPHIHCVIPAGGISPDHQHWVSSRHRFFLPVKALRRVFRGKFIAGLKHLYRRKKLGYAGPAAVFSEPKQFAKLVGRLRRQPWVVYAKPAFGRPAASATLSRPLHSPRCHLESSLVGLRWRARYLPLARLCAWQPVTRDDTRCGRVSAPLLPAHPAQSVRPHPALWIPG